ncbi:MAG: carboxypeptidase-like regulatory domain-containing protein [Bacteroidota bacterium]|nr:carboxypeptidase-like regulatory domain-containing protein [Bacteroidota bacterium]
MRCRDILIEISFLLICFATDSFTQIGIAVQIDPSPSPYISDWRSNPNTVRFIVTNPTSMTYEVRFVGYIEGERRGRIAETKIDAAIQPVIIPPGTSSFNGVDAHLVEEGVVRYIGSSRAETERTGRIPEDRYRLCIEIVSYKNPQQKLSPETCTSFEIKILSPPSLISPADKTSITLLPTFQWSAVPMGIGVFASYELTVVRLEQGQMNVAHAMETNVPFLQRETTLPLYTCLPSDPQFTAGTYAWRVRAFDPNNRYTFNNQGKSEIWSFTYREDVRITGTVPRRPSPSAGLDLSRPNFLYTGLTRIRGTLKVTFLKGMIPPPKSIIIPPPGKGQLPLPDHPTQQQLPQQQTQPQAGTLQAQGVSLAASLSKPAQALGGLHLKLYKCYQPHPTTGCFDQASFTVNGKLYMGKTLVATTVTQEDGSFEFTFFASDSTGRVAKNTSIRCGSSTSEFSSIITGDFYGFYTIEVTDPHLCSPSDRFIVQPLENADVGTLYSLVRWYTVTIRTNHYEVKAGSESVIYPLSGIKVRVMRVSRPYDIPSNEGEISEPLMGSMTVIAEGITNAMGEVSFKYLVKSVGPNDRYLLRAETAEGSEYYYYSAFESFRNSFLLDEKDDAGNGLFFDYAVLNEDYDPTKMKATEIVPMIPKPPRILGSVYRKDNPNSPVAGACILLYRTVGTTRYVERIQWTDASGKFCFENIEPAQDTSHTSDVYYQLKIIKSGFKGLLFPERKEDAYRPTIGRQKITPKILLEPDMIVSGKIVDELGRPVKAWVQIDDGEKVHTVTKFVPKRISSQPTDMNIDDNGIVRCIRKIQGTQQQELHITYTAPRAALTQKSRFRLTASGILVDTEEEFRSAYAPQPNKEARVIITPDDLATWFPETLRVCCGGMAYFGEFVVSLKLRRLAVVAVKMHSEPPTRQRTEGGLQTGGERTRTKITSQYMQQITSQTMAGGGLRQALLFTGGVMQLIQPELLFLPTEIVKDAVIRVNGMEPDSIDNEGVHYFAWQSIGANTEIHVEGPPGSNFVPRDITGISTPVSRTWTLYPALLSQGGKLAGTVRVGSVPIPNARVMLFDNPSDPTPLQTTTNSEGKYELPGVPLGLHTFRATKSSSQYIGDTVSTIVKTSETTMLDFQLTLYNDMDITHLLGFPIEVSALDSSMGSIRISGNFCNLPANAHFSVDTAKTILHFSDIVIIPSTETNVNGIPLAQPSSIPLITDVNTFGVKAFGLFKANQFDPMNGVRVSLAEGRGEITGTIRIDPASFTVSPGSIDFDQSWLYLAPPQPEGPLTLSSITSDASVPLAIPHGYRVVNESGQGLEYTLYDFPARGDPVLSYLLDDTLSLRTTVHTDIIGTVNPDLAIDLGNLRIHHASIEPILSTKVTTIGLEGEWKLIAKSWRIDNNGFTLDSGYVDTGPIYIRFTGIKVFPDHLDFGVFNLTELPLAGITTMTVTGKAVFGIDGGVGSWALSVVPQTGEDICGWANALPGMASNDKIRFNNFFIRANDSKGFTLAGGNQVTFHKVAKWNLNHFYVAPNLIQLSGNLDLQIPNFPPFNYPVSYSIIDNELKCVIVPIDQTIAVNGVEIVFIASGTNPQYWDNTGFHSSVYVQEQGAFRLRSMLHRTLQKTNIIVNQGEETYIGDDHTAKFTNVTGEMLVENDEWTLFWYEGDLQNSNQGGRIHFVVEGEIVANNQEIGVDKIETPFGDIRIVYNFQKQRLEGNLDIDCDLGGTKVKGGGNLLISGTGKGWYFRFYITFKLPTPTVEGSAVFICGNWQMEQEQLDDFAQYSYKNKPLPAQFHNLRGFFFEGTVMVQPSVFCPNFEFNFILVSAYMECMVGANARFGMNFGPEYTTFFIAIRGIIHLEAGVGLSVVVFCAGLTLGIDIEPNIEGVFQTNGDWYVKGQLPIIIYGSCYCGGGFCDSQCEGDLCVKEEASGSIEMGAEAYYGSKDGKDEQYFKFYFKSE